MADIRAETLRVERERERMVFRALPAANDDNAGLPQRIMRAPQARL